MAHSAPHHLEPPWNHPAGIVLVSIRQQLAVPGDSVPWLADLAEAVSWTWHAMGHAALQASLCTALNMGASVIAPQRESRHTPFPIDKVFQACDTHMYPRAPSPAFQIFTEFRESKQTLVLASSGRIQSSSGRIQSPSGWVFTPAFDLSEFEHFASHGQLRGAGAHNAWDPNARAREVFNLTVLVPVVLVAAFNSWTSLSSWSFTADLSSLSMTVGGISSMLALFAFGALLAADCCICSSNACILGVLCCVAAVVDVACYAAWCWYGTVTQVCTGAASLTGKISIEAAEALNCDTSWVTFMWWAYLSITGSLQLSVAFSAVNCGGGSSTSKSLGKKQRRHGYGRSEARLRGIE
ncbi:hypothetical protein JCM10212_003209 [Sporobolomyces blumeae]